MAAIAAIALAIPLAACGSSQSFHLDTSTDAYSADTQGSLTGACQGAVDSSAPSNYCECALEFLESFEPEGQLGDLLVAGMSMTTDKDIVEHCWPGHTTANSAG